MRVKRNFLSLFALGILLILALGSDNQKSAKESSYGSSQTKSTYKSTEPSIKDGIKPLITAKITKWYKGGFDNVMIADILIENQSNHDIKDIKVTCTHFAKSGTIIDSNTRTIYDVVKAKSKKKFRKFNMGLIHSQAERSAVEIEDFNTY
jgi:hypothetical protein